jgi:hypothetical protein
LINFNRIEQNIHIRKINNEKTKLTQSSLMNAKQVSKGKPYLKHLKQWQKNDKQWNFNFKKNHHKEKNKVERDQMRHEKEKKRKLKWFHSFLQYIYIYIYMSQCFQ